jgi:hypothetical protein
MSVPPSAAMAQPMPTIIVLPNGSACTWSTTVQPAANYLCDTSTNGNPNVIIGTPSLQADIWVITTGVLGPNKSIISSTQIQTDVTTVFLFDGSRCDFTGRGETVEINGQRINYTCNTPNTYLIGNFDTSQPEWTANLVVATGQPGNFNVVSSASAFIGSVINQTSTPTPAPPVMHDNRYFSQTGYRIDNDQIWTFFNQYGGIGAFGYPTSRTVSFLGCPVQFFQRQLIQICPNQGAALINILDPDIFPYTRVNGSVFPGPDPVMKANTPQVSDPMYAQKITQFVIDNVPNTWNGLPVNFFQTFNALGGLTIWGAPISQPAPDPTNANFVYQRFQRGIMHFTAPSTTESILLADYLKAIIINQNVPSDLLQDSRESRYFNQYCPGQPLWLCRPAELSGTDFTFGFVQG